MWPSRFSPLARDLSALTAEVQPEWTELCAAIDQLQKNQETILDALAQERLQRNSLHRLMTCNHEEVKIKLAEFINCCGSNLNLVNGCISNVEALYEEVQKLRIDIDVHYSTVSTAWQEHAEKSQIDCNGEGKDCFDQLQQDVQQLKLDFEMLRLLDCQGVENQCSQQLQDAVYPIPDPTPPPQTKAPDCESPVLRRSHSAGSFVVRRYSAAPASTAKTISVPSEPIIVRAGSNPSLLTTRQYLSAQLDSTRASSQPRPSSKPTIHLPSYTIGCSLVAKAAAAAEPTGLSPTTTTNGSHLDGSSTVAPLSSRTVEMPIRVPSSSHSAAPM